VFMVWGLWFGVGIWSKWLRVRLVVHVGLHLCQLVLVHAQVAFLEISTGLGFEV
jgi:hypothetical protein